MPRVLLIIILAIIGIPAVLGYWGPDALESIYSRFVGGQPAEKSEEVEAEGEAVVAEVMQVDSETPSLPLQFEEPEPEPKQPVAEKSTFSEFAQDFRDGAREFFAGFLKVQQLEVKGNYYISEAQVHRGTGLEQLPWLWQLSTDEIAAALTEHPWIEEARANLEFGSLKVKISLKEAEPWLVVSLADHKWLISRSAQLLQTLGTLSNQDLVVESAELPRLEGIEPAEGSNGALSVANTRLERGLAILKLYQLAGGFPFRIERFVYLDDGSVEAHPYDFNVYPSVRVRGNKFEEAEATLRQLGLVLDDLRSRKETAKIVDLRFRGQAVVTTLAEGEVLSAG